MSTLIHESKPVASKTYRCDAFHWVEMADIYDDLTPDEQAQYDACNRTIKPGERYLRQVQNDGGELVTFRANVAMDAICRKYKLYEEW